MIASAIKRIHVLVFVLLLISTVRKTPAPPPLVTGDVPTAEKGMFELYSGFRYQDTAAITRQVPFTELVYGVTDRQEVIVEVPFLSRKGEHGIGDIVVGTKYVFVRESERVPGIAGSFELKLPTGNEERGLGSGEFDYDLRLRTQKTWRWFTGILISATPLSANRNSAVIRRTEGTYSSLPSLRSIRCMKRRSC